MPQEIHQIANGKKMNEKYTKIINLPWPRQTESKYPRMSRSDRAAQFAPYAALSGYEAVVEEVARLTERKIELDEYEKERINSTLQDLVASPIGTQVKITYFCPDKYKDGGKYIDVVGEFSEINEYKRELILVGGYSIFIDQISELQIL